MTSPAGDQTRYDLGEENNQKNRCDSYPEKGDAERTPFSALIPTPIHLNET
jgi:hypothetical protein